MSSHIYCQENALHMKSSYFSPSMGSVRGIQSRDNSKSQHSCQQPRLCEQRKTHTRTSQQGHPLFFSPHIFLAPVYTTPRPFPNTHTHTPHFSPLLTLSKSPKDSLREQHCMCEDIQHSWKWVTNGSQALQLPVGNRSSSLIIHIY